MYINICILLFYLILFNFTCMFICEGGQKRAFPGTGVTEHVSEHGCWNSNPGPMAKPPSLQSPEYLYLKAMFKV